MTSWTSESARGARSEEMEAGEENDVLEGAREQQLVQKDEGERRNHVGAEQHVRGRGGGLSHRAMARCVWWCC